MNNSFDIGTLAHPADLPTRFDLLAPLNRSIALSRVGTVNDIFYADQVARILQCPRGDLAAVGIRTQWVGTVIPLSDFTRYSVGLIVHGDAGEVSTPPERPEIVTSSTPAIAALGLSLIQDIREGNKSPEELELRYKAFSFWSTFDRTYGSVQFSFRPKADSGVSLEQFVTIMDKTSSI